jgi:hypothetical protein
MDEPVKGWIAPSPRKLMSSRENLKAVGFYSLPLSGRLSHLQVVPLSDIRRWRGVQGSRKSKARNADINQGGVSVLWIAQALYYQNAPETVAMSV